MVRPNWTRASRIGSMKGNSFAKLPLSTAKSRETQPDSALAPGRSNRSRCKAERAGPSEAYWRYAAASARAFQRRRWAGFSGLLQVLPRIGDPALDGGRGH